MAEGKKSFVAYADWKEVFDALPNEDAGALIKHIFSYVNDENPISDSVLINAVFANIKSTLKRDLHKWETQLEQRRIAGKKSAEMRLTKSNDRSNSLNETTRNSTVSVSENVNVNVNDTVSTKVDVLEIFTPFEIVDFVNKTFGKDFTERQLPRFDRDLINNLITVNGYSKQKILSAWKNIPKDQFHISKKFNAVTFRYLSETKTIERYLFWKDENSIDQPNTNVTFSRKNLNL
jgi:hypothetical protein